MSFDKERITVRFINGDKIFNPKVAFNNHFLTLLDEQLNHQLNEEFIEKEKAVVKAQEKAQHISITRNKRVNARYKRLRNKVFILQQLFGKDFIYPPFEELKKQYRLILNEDDNLHNLLKDRDRYLAKYSR